MFETKPRNQMILACSLFLAFGMFNAAIGPVLGELAARTGSTLAAVGAVLTFLFLGSLVTQLIAGPLTDRYGLRPLLLVSLLLVVICLPGVTLSRSLPLMLALVFFTGMGQGGLDLGANLVVSSAYPRNSTSMLNLLHFFFGLGAILGPAAVGLALATLGSGLIVHWFAAAVFLVLAVIIFKLRETPPNQADVTQPASVQEATGKNIYRSPYLWLICFLILVYVGVEYGSGSWITTFMGVTTGMLEKNGALVTSAYWAALTVGRLAGAAAGARLGHTRLLILAIFGSLLGSILFAFGVGNLVFSIGTILILGFSFGTIYPTSVAITVSAFPADQGKAVGLLAAMGSIGGLSLPWVAGVLLENVSPLAYSLFLITGCTLMLTLFLGFLSHKKRNPPSLPLHSEGQRDS
ncbi:MAG: MFS transporter [Anaerolineaceae bacterium]